MKILQKVLGGLLFFDSHCTSQYTKVQQITPFFTGRKLCPAWTGMQWVYSVSKVLGCYFFDPHCRRHWFLGFLSHVYPGPPLALAQNHKKIWDSACAIVYGERKWSHKWPAFYHIYTISAMSTTRPMGLYPVLTDNGYWTCKSGFSFPSHKPLQCNNINEGA